MVEVDHERGHNGSEGWFNTIVDDKEVLHYKVGKYSGSKTFRRLTCFRKTKEPIRSSDRRKVGTRVSGTDTVTGPVTLL